MHSEETVSREFTFRFKSDGENIQFQLCEKYTKRRKKQNETHAKTYEDAIRSSSRIGSPFDDGSLDFFILSLRVCSVGVDSYTFDSLSAQKFALSENLKLTETILILSVLSNVNARLCLTTRERANPTPYDFKVHFRWSFLKGK